jgi:hypothetical protein
MVTYGLLGVVIGIILLVLLVGGRVLVDNLRQKPVAGRNKFHP